MTVPRPWAVGVLLVLAWLFFAGLFLHPLLAYPDGFTDNMGAVVLPQDVLIRFIAPASVLALVLIAAAREVCGTEYISLDRAWLEHRVDLIGMRWTKRYSLRMIGNPRVCHGPYPTDSLARRAMGGIGLVRFDYAGKPKHIGVGLDGPRARALVAELSGRMAQADGRMPYR